MAIDERARHRLYLRLEEVLGPEDAEVLMGHLPPVGWADVATKHDLDQRLEITEHKLMAAFRGEMLTQTKFMVRTMIIANAASVITVGGLAFVAAKLT